MFLLCSCEEEYQEVYVDKIPPTVSIQSLISNQTINGTVTIVVETNDKEGINRVEFYIDDSLFFTDTESPYEYAWNTTEYEDSSDYTIKVVSYDNSENSAEFQIVVWVDNTIEIEVIPEYFGTYLYNDHDCSGSDIQYATLDENGITFFDYLGDSCDDTVSCYAMDIYELTVLSQDTFLVVSEDSSSITDGEMYLDGDSSITISYEGNNGPVEYSWEKISSEIYSFTPVCDQEYGYNKDIADIMVYAVSDDGDLLWKNYLHEGIWELGSSVTPLSDGGYMVYGLLDAINWGGCCYTRNSDVRDIVKLDDNGSVEWQKEIEFDNGGMTTHYNGIGKGLIETSYGDLVFLAPSLYGGVSIVMMDANGSFIWNQNYPDMSSWSYHAEIMETEDGDLAVVAGSTTRLKLLDYYSGEILSENEYQGLAYARAIINVGGDFLIGGFTSDQASIIAEGDTISYKPIYLMMVDNDGEEIWRKVWDQETERMGWLLDVIETDDGGFMIFCETNPPPYATLIKTDDEGNEEWRKKYDDYVGGGQGWIHITDDGGYFMASGYAVTKLDANGDVEWNAAAPSGFDKNFNNGMVSGVNYDMKQIEGGAVMVGYGSADWE